MLLCSFFFLSLLLVFCTIKVSSVVELVLSMHTSYALIYRNIQLHMSTVKRIQYLICKKIRVLMYDFFLWSRLYCLIMYCFIKRIGLVFVSSTLGMQMRYILATFCFIVVGFVSAVKQWCLYSR